MEFTEDIFNKWILPPDDLDEEKLSDAVKIITDIIHEDKILGKMKIEVFGQGSYSNDTNVKLNNEIDINVRYMDNFYLDLQQEKNDSDFGLNARCNYSSLEFKSAVENTLVNKFGKEAIERNDKYIYVKGNVNRIAQYIVPTCQYRRYSGKDSYEVGVKFQTDKGDWISNFPLQHIANAKTKNYRTQNKFKHLVRIFKRLRYKMIEDGDYIKAPSFLLECLAWNIPDKIYNDNDSWSKLLKQSLIYLFNNIRNPNLCKNWYEASGLLPLFHSDRKWTVEDVNIFLVRVWIYLKL